MYLWGLKSERTEEIAKKIGDDIIANKRETLIHLNPIPLFIFMYWSIQIKNGNDFWFVTVNIGPKTVFVASNTLQSN